MTLALRGIFLTIGFFLSTLTLHAAELPHIKMENGTGQLIVNGQAYLTLGGNLGNSSAGTQGQADLIVPKLARMHVNTILMPIAWEQIEATLSRSWPARTVIADDGAMLVLQASPEEFYIIGNGLTVSFARDPDVDGKIAGIASVEQVARVSGQWTTERRLNGDQTNQGRQLLLDPRRPHIFRVRLYSVPPEQRHSSQ